MKFSYDVIAGANRKMHVGNRQLTHLLFFAHSIKVPFSRNSIFDSIAKFDISHKTPNRHRPEQQLIDAESTLVDSAWLCIALIA